MHFVVVFFAIVLALLGITAFAVYLYRVFALGRQVDAYPIKDEYLQNWSNGYASRHTLHLFETSKGGFKRACSKKEYAAYRKLYGKPFVIVVTKNQRYRRVTTK